MGDRDTIKARYDAILAREKRHARAIALLVFEMESISVWQVIVLPLLVISVMRQRQTRDAFVANFLFTKKVALEGALDVVCQNRSRETVLARFEAETARIRDETPEDFYSEDVRQAQLSEVGFLLDHDVRLLMASALPYDDLVRGAYATRTAYRACLDRLAELEREVSDAAERTVGPKADRTLARRMHAGASRVRDQEAERIYGAGGEEGR